MKIVTYGEWKGSLIVEGNKGDNHLGDTNFTYNTKKEADEVEIVLRLRPGKTNMIIDITDKRESTAGTGLNSGKDNRSYCIYKILAGNRPEDCQCP